MDHEIFYMIIKNKIAEDARREDEVSEAAYPLFRRVLTERGFKVGVEIGVAFGGHSEAMLRQTQIEKLYGVDPYRHFDDYDDEFGADVWVRINNILASRPNPPPQPHHYKPTPLHPNPTYP